MRYLLPLLFAPLVAYAGPNMDIDFSGKTIVTLIVVLIAAAVVYYLLTLLIDRLPIKSEENKAWIKYILLFIAVMVAVVWILKWIGWW